MTFMKLFRHTKYDRRHAHTILLIVTILLASYLRFAHLGSSIFNDDAHFWYQRSTGFIDAVQKHEWAETYQNSKPGVTVTWLSGTSLETFMRVYFAKNGFRPLLYTQDTFHLVHFAVKAPLVLASVLFLVFFYIVVRHLFTQWVALFSTILLAFEPFYIGVSRWFHVEGLLAVCMPLSALLLLMYIINPRRWLLLLSGVVGGLALLTKTQGIFLVLYTPLVLALALWCSRAGGRGMVRTLFSLMRDKDTVITFFRDYGMWLVAAAVTFTVLFPAMWVAPLETLEKIVSDSVYTGTVGRNNIEGPLFYLYALPLRLSPVLLFLFVWGVGYFIRFFRRIEMVTRTVLLSVVLYLFFYVLMMSLAQQKIDRYLLAGWPMIALLGGYGVYAVKERVLQYTSPLIVGVILFLITFGSAWRFQPYFSTYYSPLLGGRDGAMRVLAPESIGEVYPAVGMHINEHEGAREFTTVVSMLPQSIRPFMQGRVYHKGEELPVGESIDYVVLPWYQELPLVYEPCVQEHTVLFRGRPYWELYRCPLDFRADGT